MLRLLRRLGDPQDGLKIVHVAGTKGKGSTSAMLAAALIGLRPADGSLLLAALAPAGRAVHPRRSRGLAGGAGRADGTGPAGRRGPRRRRRPGRKRAEPTFCRITTAMGLLHFARRRADAVVLEVGLGGRLDSTNVVRPLLAVLTSISFDHTRQLGNTLDAFRKIR